MKKTTVFIQDYDGVEGAMKWIYNGYHNAWENLGYTPYYMDKPDHALQHMCELSTSGQDYYIMASDIFWKAVRDACLELDMEEGFDAVIKNSKKFFLFVLPVKFPPPWGGHNNFRTLLTTELIEFINEMDNHKLWTFIDSEREDVKKNFFSPWKDVKTVPLAFDNISYKYLEDEKYKFDVCYIGGRADNGFDEKYKIMWDHFSAFKDSGLKCGIFLGRNLTHEQENKILYNSKVSINVHDAYQRELGLDTNERTYKALGLTGVMVSEIGRAHV